MPTRNIGNRQQATEDNDVTVYDANALNQYTAISENGSAAFVPQFDADGNQTLIKTDTGIWSAVYNAENRPVTFTNSESNTVVECQYDCMGRRCFKKVITNGIVTLHQRYIYRGYLQIASLDLTRRHHPVLWFLPGIQLRQEVPVHWLFKKTGHGTHNVTLPSYKRKQPLIRGSL